MAEHDGEFGRPAARRGDHRTVELAEQPAAQFEFGSQRHAAHCDWPRAGCPDPRNPPMAKSDRPLWNPNDRVGGMEEGTTPQTGKLNRVGSTDREIPRQQKSAACKGPAGTYNEKSGPLEHHACLATTCHATSCAAHFSGRNDSVGAVSRAGWLSHRRDVAHFVHREQRWRRNISLSKKLLRCWGWRRRAGALPRTQ